LEQDIEREIYHQEKAKLFSEKKSLEEQITKLEQKQNDWVEPMENWINYAQTLEKIASDSNLFSKKVAAKEVFGSNLLLASREARLRAPSGIDSEPQNQWAALRAAHEMASEKPKSMVLMTASGFEPATTCVP
jgi:predicted phage tail protein